MNLALQRIACGNARWNALGEAKIHEGTSKIQRMMMARNETGLR